MICKKLSYGDTIGLISPASPEKPENIEKGINFLRSKGFNIKEGKHLYDKWGYLAGSDKDRASDLMEMFLDDSVDMVLCVRGGYGVMRTLPYINFDIIKNNPKIFMGFSDITVYLNYISNKCDLITFHGPMGSSNLEDSHTFTSFIDTLMNGTNLYCIDNPVETPIHCLNIGTASGKLVGGNLSLLCSTLGTPYEIDTKDNILFIEDIGEEPYRIDRLLTQLLLANKLQECSGIILGQFTNCDLPHYDRSLTLEEIIEDRIVSLNKPSISNFMSGHSYPKLTLPIGAKVQLDCRKLCIKILEPVVHG
ncbi:MAG: LD-carboxypeptidase [Bacillota bacterium]|nr:LD-carboxypeptidase [Bacillota bacterium]